MAFDQHLQAGLALGRAGRLRDRSAKDRQLLIPRQLRYPHLRPERRSGPLIREPVRPATDQQSGVRQKEHQGEGVAAPLAWYQLWGGPQNDSGQQECARAKQIRRDRCGQGRRTDHDGKIARMIVGKLLLPGEGIEETAIHPPLDE
jgi:hypothetical protein